MRSSHLWNHHHLRLLPFLPTQGVPILRHRPPNSIFLTFHHPFFCKAIRTSRSLSPHRQLRSLSYPIAASCLPHTRASSSSESFGVADSEVLLEYENSDGSNRDIIPTLSATIKCSGEIVVLSIGPVAWDRKKQQFWKKSKLVALFPPGHNVEESLAFAFNSMELNERLPYEVKVIEHQNWVQQVKDMFRPLKISDSLWIIPEWSSPPDASAINVLLEPGLAFGTGSHPTTRLCLQWLNQIVKGGERILDYGTGSGILEISGLKFK